MTTASEIESLARARFADLAVRVESVETKEYRPRCYPGKARLEFELRVVALERDYHAVIWINPKATFANVQGDIDALHAAVRDSLQES